MESTLEGAVRNGHDELLQLAEIRVVLDRVLWIGGPPDAGKTTVASVIAARHGLDVYHFDRHEMAHFARANQVDQPALWAAHPDRMDPEQRWFGSSPETMAEATMASWRERCSMAFEDIAAIVGDGPIIAEGPGFFPELLSGIVTDRRKAIWLLPSDAFKRASALARGKPGSRRETSDPERATANIIARDLIMGRVIREQIEALGLEFIVVTGEQSVEKIVGQVERHFDSWLTATR